MVSKLTNFLKDVNAGDRVAKRIEEYERRYGDTARGAWMSARRTIGISRTPITIW